MFERKKLALLWREAHDYSLLAHVANESGMLEDANLFRVAMYCEPLMIMYAQNLPLPSSMRQKGIGRLPADRIAMDVHRTHGRLLKRMRIWMSISPQKQAETLRRVLGVRSAGHAQDILSLGQALLAA